MKHNKLKKEEEAHDIISALGKLSRDAQASPEFLGRVMVQADQLSSRRPRFFTWVTQMSVWPSNMGVRLAFAALLVIAIIGAVPQYISWINSYATGVSSQPTDVITEMQAKLWEKNLACSHIDESSNKFAEIDGAPGVSIWADCPSGDVLVSFFTNDNPTEPKRDHALWVPYGDAPKNLGLFDLIVPKAHAIDYPQLSNLVAATIKKVLCQKKLSNGFIKRRIKLSNNKCYDETLNPRTGKIEKRQESPCDCRDF